MSVLRPLSALAIVALALAAAPALAHSERPVEFPPGTGEVPSYRSTGPAIVVCKADSAARAGSMAEPARSRTLALVPRCRFHHVQAAVDAVSESGSRILVLPGHYFEEPSLAPEPSDCDGLSRPISYDDQVKCPHHDNLIAILGDGPDADRACTTERLCRLQVEGTGASPYDVILDANWKKLNVLRADRADGVYFRNFVVQRSDFNALYVLEQDGFVIDRVVGRWNYEYGFLTFAVDHGLYVDCEGYGNGDSGIYPGSASDQHGARHSVEITRCDSHHNALGYSGTSGNAVWAHHNRFHHNSAGVSTDSAFPDHPGLPQDSARFEFNEIYSNNVNYYGNWDGADAPCRRSAAERGVENGVVCPVVPVPVGTGILLAGGNNNVFAYNQFWDNWRIGGMQFSVPAIIREETDPTKAFDTSHNNRWLRNAMGVAPDGAVMENGLDFWWDEEGSGNCWYGNTAPGSVTSDPATLPACGGTPLFMPPNPLKVAQLLPCAMYSVPDNTRPVGCTWMDTPARPS